MLLSIIIPNHNYAGYVDAAIRGAVDQADADVEIFVVDDGSTDRSWERIERYARYVDCARVELRNARLSALHAFRRSRGRYVMVLDADDMLRDGAIARIKQAIATGAALVQAPLDVVGPDNRSLGYRFPRMAPSIGREDAIASIEATGSYVSPPTSASCSAATSSNFSTRSTTSPGSTASPISPHPGSATSTGSSSRSRPIGSMIATPPPTGCSTCRRWSGSVAASSIG